MNSELSLNNVHYSNKAFNRICICCFRYFVQTNIVYFYQKKFFFCFWIGIVVSGDFTRRVRHHSASICCQVSNPGSCAHLLLLRFNPEQLIRFSHPYSRPIIFTHYHTFSHSNVRIYLFSPFFDFISF